jgi:hypothetical protein
MCRQKKLSSLEAKLVPFYKSFLPLSENPDVHPQKKRTVKPGDAFEDSAFEQLFENVKGCREAAVHLSVKQIPPTDSWHQADSDRCDFHPLMPALTIVSLLERFL